jgi:hypothetical protein
MCIFRCCLKSKPISEIDTYKVLPDECKCNIKTITRLLGDNLHECQVCKKLHRCAYTYYCNFCTSKQPFSDKVIAACYYCGFLSLTLTKHFTEIDTQYSKFLYTSENIS